MHPYLTFEKEGVARLEVKKSEFIGYAAHVTTEAEARAFVERIRKQHADARHHVYAYTLAENNILRYSDDGEPQGTGGLPVLEVLRKQGLSDGVIVVTRYFGGILLGTGGLTRAYSAAAVAAADNAGIASFVPYDIFRLSLSYPLFQRLPALFKPFRIHRDGEEYDDKVTVTLAVDAEQTAALLEALSELGGGAVTVTSLGKRLDRRL